VRLSFHDVENADALRRTLEADTLSKGFAEELTLITLEGATFTVNLSSVCR
jgi:hypothetical protein